MRGAHLACFVVAILAWVSSSVFAGELEVQFGILDHAVFHLDGPDAVKHLPVLYELFEKHASFSAIQWVHGEGSGPMMKWVPLLKEIQSRGISLHLTCRPQEVETLVRELSSKGLFLRTSAKNKEEADSLVNLAAKLTHE